MKILPHGQLMADDVNYAAVAMPHRPAASIDTVKEQARRLMPALFAAGILMPAGLGLNYLLNVLLARVLPMEGYGVFVFALSLTSVTALAASLGFSQSMMRLVPAHRVKGEHSQLTGLVRGSFLLAGGASLVIAIIMIVIALTGGAQKLDTGIFWAALLLPLLTIDLWRESSMRGLHRTADVLLPRQVLLPLIIILLVLTFRLDNTQQVLALYLGTFALLELAALFRLYHALSPVMTPQPSFHFRYWLGISGSMGMSSLAYQGLRQWDIVVVGTIVGLDAAGLYTAASRTALLASLVQRTVNMVIGPVLAELYHAGEFNHFRKLFISSTLGSALLGTPLYMLVLLYAGPILSLFGEEYREAALLLQILATGEFVNLVAGPASMALTMSRHEKLNMVVVTSAAAFSLAALVLLVPEYGIISAAIVTASVTVVIKLIQFGYACHFLIWRDGKHGRQTNLSLTPENTV